MTSIILPTYNEARTIRQVVADVAKYLPDSEIIIVDDNSPDGTGRIADELSKQYNVEVIHRARRLGLSSAIAAGFKAANRDIIGVMDADLSHPAKILPELLRPLTDGKADIVIGSRRVQGGGDDEWSPYRQMVSWGATMMARALTPVKDPMSGLFFLKKEVLGDMKIESRGYKIGLEILVKGNYDKVVEIPYMFIGRKVGSSKLNAREYVKYVVDWSRLVSHKLMGTRRKE